MQLNLFKKMLKIFSVLFLLFLLSLNETYASKEFPIIYLNKKRDMTIFEDQSYELISTAEWKALKSNSIANKGISFDYSPSNSTIEVEEAYIIKPDGKKIVLTANDQNIVSSPPDENIPGFTDSKRLTLIFPNVQNGSLLYYRIKQRFASTTRFDWMISINSEYPTKHFEINILAPESFYLNASATNGLTLKEYIDPKTKIRHIRAIYKNYVPIEGESNMVPTANFLPALYVTQAPSWEYYGALAHKENQGSLEITPEVIALSNKIVGNSTGLEAARKIYNWVRDNITYLYVYMDPNQTYKAHKTSEILEKKYGDCKDHAVLLKSLLAVQGIESLLAVVHTECRGSLRISPISGHWLNHMILYLPKEDIFLDATHNSQGFGEMAGYLRNQIVILATEKGKLIKTPPLSPQDNVYRNYSHIRLLKDGTFEGTSEWVTKGHAATWLRGFIKKNSNLSSEQLAEKFLETHSESLSGTLNHTEMSPDVPLARADIFWRKEEAVLMEKKIAFSMPIGLDVALSPPSNRKSDTFSPRKYPFYLRAVTYDLDSVLDVPKNYKIVKIPESLHLKNKEGNYESKYVIKNGALIIKRKLIINKSIHLPEEQEEINALTRTLFKDLGQVVGIEKL